MLLDGPSRMHAHDSVLSIIHPLVEKELLFLMVLDLTVMVRYHHVSLAASGWFPIVRPERRCSGST